MDPSNLILAIAALILITIFTKPESSSYPLDEDAECMHQVSSFVELDPREVKQFDMLNDERVIGNSELECKPESFGYSAEEAERLFPDVKFGECKERYKHKDRFVYIEGDTLYMNCTGKYKGKYVLGVNYTQEEFGYYDFDNEPKEYKKPVSIGDVEYVLATCDPDRVEDLEQIAYRNRLNQASLLRAQSSLKSPPINIAMVVLDSVSRRSFYRKLPETVSFLNSQLTDHSVFDFLVHHVMGEYSCDSFMPTFFGDMPYKRLKENTKGDEHYERSLWKILHERVISTLGLCNHDGQ